MKIDTILPLGAGCAVRITAGAPVMRGGRCFAPVTIRPLATCRCCSGSGWAAEDRTED